MKIGVLFWKFLQYDKRKGREDKLRDNIGRDYG